MQAGVAEGLFAVVERAPLRSSMAATISPVSPTDGTEAFEEGAVGVADASAALGLASGGEREHVRHGGYADEAVHGEHGDAEGVDAAGFVIQVEEVAGEQGVHAGETAHRARPAGMSMNDRAMIRKPWMKSV